jgi:uncharacterized protein (DUF1501 family)
MLEIGDFRAGTCSGVTRRSFLQFGSSLPAALGLAGGTVRAQTSETAKAKSVIFVFLWGAPSHLDTFDPKPNAPSEYRGPFGTIPTRTPGVHFSELLPRTAARSDRFTLVRTNVGISSSGGHPRGGTVALTGFEEMPEPVQQPTFGSIIEKHRGHTGSLPGFFSLTNGKLTAGGEYIKGDGGGILSRAHDPFMVGCSQQGVVKIPSMKLLKGLSPARITDRRTLLTHLNADRATLDSEAVRDWGRTWGTAYDLMMDSTARSALDLTRESEATRARYGQSEFGQSALLALRLAEARVPYIQLNYSRDCDAFNPGFEIGWDTHIYNFELLQDQLCPIFDRAFSALLDDLSDRGIMDDTLVVCMGEFGRTPKISNRAARDHWTKCYFSLWAGGGVQGGRVIGESDRTGQEPHSGPAVTTLNVGTTIAELAGVTSQARAEMKVLEGGTVIDELL